VLKLAIAEGKTNTYEEKEISVSPWNVIYKHYIVRELQK
jgi:hypothetical protein